MSEIKLPDLGGLLEAAQQMQTKMTQLQQELATKEVHASSGGGMVTATVNGRFELVKLEFDPTVIDPADPTMLRDLVIAAVNQALAKARDMSQSEMAKLTGGISLPGMPLP